MFASELLVSGEMVEGGEQVTERLLLIRHVHFLALVEVEGGLVGSVEYLVEYLLVGGVVEGMFSVVY